MSEETRIAIPVHFWVSVNDGSELSREDAKRAAEYAAYHYLALFDGENEMPFAQIEVDVLGVCNVGICELDGED